MNKRRILAIAMSLCIVAILAVGASLAYFTDTDSKTNTFTTGKVDITLVEDFNEETAKLIPGSQTENAVKKKVSIKLEEKSEDAWVWYEWLIPAALDDPKDASKNIVHVNAAGSTWDKYRENSKYWPDGQTEALPLEKTWNHDYAGVEGFVGTEKDKETGIVYNKYVALYRGKLSAGEETTICMNQVYMDSHVDTDGTNYTLNGEAINYDFSKGVKIIVRAYGIQANGFDDVFAAYEAYQAQVNG